MFGPIATFVENLLANWVADAYGPTSMIGVSIAIVAIVIMVIGWHRRQRAAKKPGMASWQFIALCFTISLLAVAAGAYGLGLKFAGKAFEVASNQPPLQPTSIPPQASPTPQPPTASPSDQQFERAEAARLVRQDGPLEKLHAVLSRRIISPLDPFHGWIQFLEEANAGDIGYDAAMAKISSFQTDFNSAQEELRTTLKDLSYDKDYLDKIVATSNADRENRSKLQVDLAELMNVLKLYETWAHATFNALESEIRRLRKIAQ
jgi:hypothetical protein